MRSITLIINFSNAQSNTIDCPDFPRDLKAKDMRPSIVLSRKFKPVYIKQLTIFASKP